MRGRFHPSFEGTWKPERLADGFGEAFARRIRQGLLPRAKPRRNRYEVLSHSRDAVRFRSASVLTGINVGWNDVDVRLDRALGAAHYTVVYWTWARYAIFLGLGLLLVFAAVVGVPALLGSDAVVEELSSQRTGVLFVGVPMMVFWCLLWPWILIAMHKKHAKAGFENLLNEVNEAAQAADAR